jgi:hypothetical protein
LTMTRRFVWRALTAAALTCGVAATAPVVRAHDHQKGGGSSPRDPYIAQTSPEAVQQTSPEAVQQESSPKAVHEAVSGSSPKDPYIAETSPKKVHEHVQHVHVTSPKVAKVHESKYATLVGCFIRMVDSDGDHATYTLADAVPGPATTVADQNCVASGTGQLLKLKNADDVGINQLASGRWVEVYGELGHPKDADDMRKFELKSFREVPLTPQPRIAILVVPQPAPQAAVETPPEQEQAVTESPKPIATAGETPMEKKLPKTASELPLVALLGLFAISGGLALSALNRSRVFGRE